MTVTPNLTLQKIRRGELALGFSVRLVRSGEIAKIAKACDHDFLFIDIEHSALSLESAAAISVAAIDSGITPIVRVAGHEHFHATRILDSGAMGVVIPHVNNAEQAKAAVANCRFPPVGHRSVVGGYAQLGFKSVPVGEATRLLNENTLLAVMVETPEAVENIDAIAAVPGIDVIHIGFNDLLAEMGMPGQFADERVARILERVIAACRANGKVAGLGGVRDPELCARYVKLGARFMTTHSDLAFMMEAASKRAAQMRALDLR